LLFACGGQAEKEHAKVIDFKRSELGGNMGYRINHADVVKKLLDNKTVDFGAVGKAVAELGPGLSVADEPWEVICGTMRYFIRLYIVNPHGGPSVEDLGGLRNAGANIGG
jgi:hypothetical protein